MLKAIAAQGADFPHVFDPGRASFADRTDMFSGAARSGSTCTGATGWFGGAADYAALSL
ncbi:MAG: hypothetical protein AAYR33_00940 [Acetobacteraceae bacterium]